MADAGAVAPIPQLTVVGSNEVHPAEGLRAFLADGTAASTVGGIVAGGFGVEAFKSFAAEEPAGRWWFVGVFLAGLVLVAIGLVQRARARRRVKVGVVVTAVDERRGASRARQLDQQAEAFSRGACGVTLRAKVELPAGQRWACDAIDALAEQTVTAAALAERLSPDAAQINLIPTMPLHVGFRFGARLGYTHAREVVVHSIRQADGAPAYFPAVALRAQDPRSSPVTVDRLESVPGGSPTRAALALDLQGRGNAFFDAVVDTCTQRGIGWLLRVHSASERLAEDQETFTAVVEQTCRAWRDAPLPREARVGQHAIFLSGPVALAVALGARLAAPEHGQWTAFTFDAATGVYEPLPADPDQA